ncbi:hypothetical protein D3C74_326830 [compost metagenome]
MGNKTKAVVPSEDHVLNAGNALETTGTVLAVIGLLLGFLLVFVAQNPFGFGLIPIGLLVMITGYTKKMATTNAAMFIIKMHERETNASASRVE